MWMTFLKETLRNYHRRMKEEPSPEHDFFDMLCISRKKKKERKYSGFLLTTQKVTSG